MKKQNFILLLILFSSLVSYSQRVINADIDYNIFENQDIIIKPTTEDLHITGSIVLTSSVHSITIIPTANYSVSIVAPDDGVTSKIGIEEEDEDITNPTIYPNPTTESITIATEEEITSLELYNSYGVKQADPVLETDNTVSLVAYSNGVYRLKIQLSTGKIVNKTLVKQ